MDPTGSPLAAARARRAPGVPWGLSALAAPLLVLASGIAQAKETRVDAAPLGDKKVRLDGMLREWPALSPLAESVSGSGRGAPTAEGVVGYDDKYLYVAMRVLDSQFVRTGGMGKNEDHGSLVIVFPTGGGTNGAGTKSYEVRLYAGEPGKSAGAVKVEGLGKVPDSQIVEAPVDGGLTFEARIPWAAFPEAKRARSGLRGALRYTDVDPGGATAVVGTSRALGDKLPPLTIEAEYALHNALISPKGLSLRPDRQFTANLVGDGMLETVAVYDRYLTVTGWNYRGGSEFYYQDLKLTSPGGLTRFELADVNADGRSDLILQRRVGSAGDARDYLEVWFFRSPDAPPEPLFQHEVGLVKGSARIENEVALSQKKGKWSVMIGQGKVTELDPEQWDGPTISGDRATLMPWESVKSRRYEWDGQTFALVEEDEWKPKLPSPARSRSGGSSTGHDPLPSEPERAPEAPRPPNAAELQDKVYALYRTDRGTRKATPRFDFVTDVAGDETNERVLVHDKDIVVFGSRFKGGTSYVYTTIGVKEAKDVLDVTARDVTGDGRADIIVRGIIPVKASKQLGGDVVTRHAVMIYRVTESGIERVFAAETGRSLEDNAILGRIAFVPVGKAVQIELRPGRSVGWTEASYPFPEDKLPYGGLEPLLLPWTTMPARRYSFAGSGFQLVE